MRNLHTYFQSGCTNLHSHQQVPGFPFLPVLAKCLLFLVFFIIVVLTGMGDNLIVVLICIPLCLVMLSTFSYFLWKNVYSVPRPIFQLDSFFWVVWVFFFFMFWILILYQIRFANIFSYLVCCLFILVDSLLCCADIFSLMSFHLFIFALT